jgi:hypothetical protein
MLKGRMMVVAEEAPAPRTTSLPREVVGREGSEVGTGPPPRGSHGM